MQSGEVSTDLTNSHGLLRYEGVLAQQEPIAPDTSEAFSLQKQNRSARGCCHFALQSTTR